MKFESPVSGFLVSLFERLDRDGISYCVLRNYEGLPDVIGNDLDLLVSPAYVQAFEDVLREILRETGWRLVKNLRRYGYGSYWMYDGPSNRFMHVDVFQKVMWKGLRFADEDLFLRRRRKRGLFYVPAPEAEAGTLLLKDLLQCGGVRGEYRARIVSVAEDNPEAFFHFLIWGLGKGDGTLLHTLVLTRQWDRIEALKGRMRSALVRTSLRRSPTEACLMTIRFVGGHLRAAFFRPQGFFIVFIGPDGSGKTTVATLLSENLAGLFPENLLFHGRFGILPDLRHYVNIFRRMAGRRPLPTPGHGVNATHDILPHSRLRVMLYLAYYGLDYFFGGCVVRRARRRGILLLFDRYYYDYFIQDALAKMPRFLFRPLALILPRPDLVVYLSCPPDVVLQRKPELSREQIERQQERCEEIVRKLPHATVLPSVLPIEEVVSRIAFSIITSMEERQDARPQI